MPEDLKCGNEGVDNSVLGWSSDFFVATTIGGLSVHLFRNTSKKAIGSIAFINLCLGYLLKGFAALFFGNSGTDGDGKGMPLYFFLTLVQYVVWTISAVLVKFLAQSAWVLILEGRRKCGNVASMLFLVPTIGSATAVAIGCIWASLWFPVDQVVDEYDEDDGNINDQSVAISMVRIGQLVWHASFSLFLVATSFVFGALAKQDTVIVGGMPNYVASSGIVIAQLTVVGIVFYFAFAGSINDQAISWGVRNGISVATVVFNFAMVMSVLFLHNLITSLFPRPVREEKSNRYPKENSDVEMSLHYDEESMEESTSSCSRFICSRFWKKNGKTRKERIEDTEEELSESSEGIKAYLSDRKMHAEVSPDNQGSVPEDAQLVRGLVHFSLNVMSHPKGSPSCDLPEESLAAKVVLHAASTQDEVEVLLEKNDESFSAVATDSLNVNSSGGRVDQEMGEKTSEALPRSNEAKTRNCAPTIVLQSENPEIPTATFVEKPSDGELITISKPLQNIEIQSNGVIASGRRTPSAFPLSDSCWIVEGKPSSNKILFHDVVEDMSLKDGTVNPVLPNAAKIGYLGLTQSGIIQNDKDPKTEENVAKESDVEYESKLSNKSPSVVDEARDNSGYVPTVFTKIGGDSVTPYTEGDSVAQPSLSGAGSSSTAGNSTVGSGSTEVSLAPTLNSLVKNDCAEAFSMSTLWRRVTGNFGRKAHSDPGHSRDIDESGTDTPVLAQLPYNAADDGSELTANTNNYTLDGDELTLNTNNYTHDGDELTLNTNNYTPDGDELTTTTNNSHHGELCLLLTANTGDELTANTNNSDDVSQSSSRDSTSQSTSEDGSEDVFRANEQFCSWNETKGETSTKVKIDNSTTVMEENLSSWRELKKEASHVLESIGRTLSGMSAQTKVVTNSRKAVRTKEDDLV